MRDEGGGGGHCGPCVGVALLGHFFVDRFFFLAWFVVSFDCWWAGFWRSEVVLVLVSQDYVVIVVVVVGRYTVAKGQVGLMGNVFDGSAECDRSRNGAGLYLFSIPSPTRPMD